VSGRGLCFDGRQVSTLSLIFPNSFQVDVICGEETWLSDISKQQYFAGGLLFFSQVCWN